MSALARLARVPELVRGAVAGSSAGRRATRGPGPGLRRPSREEMVRLVLRILPGPRGRRRAAILALAATLLVAVYYLGLRDSALVGVDEVTVTGTTGGDAAKIRAALVRAGEDMTTLHVDSAALERAVAAFPEVRAIEADPDFPSALRITVIEWLPAAVLVTGEGRLAVAADGTILPALTDPGPLPEVKLDGPPPRGRLTGGDPYAVVQVLGNAPRELAPQLERATREPDRGVVVALADGPELVFGDTARLEAKWAAAVRVLADGDAGGAAYIDVTIPERPAAGGLEVETLAPVVPAGEEVAVEPVAPEAVP